MNGLQAVLYVQARSHLGSASNHNPDFSAIYKVRKPAFFLEAVIIRDKSNMTFWHAISDKFSADVVVNGETFSVLCFFLNSKIRKYQLSAT